MIVGWLGLWVCIGPLLLRSGQHVEPERIAGVTPQGVELKAGLDESGLPAVTMVAWADVATIEPGWAGAEPFRDLADAAYRAERRLERGDLSGCGRLLEPYAAEHLGLRGETSAAFASALCMTRVLGDDRPGAARAWLAWRVAPAGPARPWLDPGTGLCPSLPPVWTPDDAAEYLKWLDGPAEGTAGTLAGLYARAARVAAGIGDGGGDGVDPRDRSDAGVRLVEEVVKVQAAADATELIAARDALRRRLRSQPRPWEDAWCRLGLGAAGLRSDDRLEADAGAGELVFVLVEHQWSAPGLAAVARDLLIPYFVRTGRPEHARAAEMMDHAALHAFRSSAVPPSPTGPGATQEPP